MTTRLLLHFQASPLTSLRDWRDPQRAHAIDLCIRPQNYRVGQRPSSIRKKHICAATELQQSSDVSTSSLHRAPGAAVEISHVSKAFGDRKVPFLIFCSCFSVGRCLDQVEWRSACKQLSMPQCALTHCNAGGFSRSGRGQSKARDRLHVLLAGSL